MEHEEPVLTAARLERPEPDVASLVALARGGDLSAFETVYRMHSGKVFSICLRLAADRNEAEEFAQDAWVRAWERIGTFRGDAAFGTWIHRLTVNLLLDRKRHDARWRQRVTSIEDEGAVETAAAVAAAPETRLDIERAVERLPEGALVIFLLHEVDGLKMREIAEQLGIAIGTVKAQLHRARRLLQESLNR